MAAWPPVRISSKRLTCVALWAALFSFAATIVVAQERPCPAPRQSWNKVELYFGLSRSNGSLISNRQFQHFVEREIVPRFPGGFTVLHGDGYWQAPSGRPVHEPSRVILIWYRPNAESEARVEALRARYKVLFKQQSVLRADVSGCISQ